VSAIKKFQTDDPPAFVPNGIITGGQKFGQRYGTTVLNVLVIKYSIPVYPGWENDLCKSTIYLLSQPDF
jgi:hypothetical protein